MNNCIKHLVEAFDFNSAKKQNKKINAIDVILQYIIQKISSREKLSQDDYDNILTNRVGIYKVSEREELLELIDYSMKYFGNECNLNWLDVSNVTDMSSMFYESDFNGDISQWNVSKVTNMNFMFSNSQFTGDISQWDVCNVINMNWMFCKSQFNSDISQWDVSNVTEKINMFKGCPIKAEYKPKFKK